MPSTCCVGKCNSNYESEIKLTGETVPVFRFPSLNDKVRSRKQWFDSLPNIVADTESKRICEKHWPENYETINIKGRVLPLNPPSVFNLPDSCCRQTIDQPRNVETRNVDSESRRLREEERKNNAKREIDTIKSLSNLESYCRNLNDVSFIKREKNIQLHAMSDKIPPVHLYSIVIHNDFKVECYKSGYYVPVRDLLGFSAKLELFSQLMNIMERMHTFKLDVTDIAKVFGSNLETLIAACDDDKELTHRVLLLAEQLKIVSSNQCGNRYSTSPISFRTAISLYLRSRSCYRELRKTLSLPHPKTIQSCFGKLGTPGTDEECRSTTAKVFETLNEQQLFTKVMVDEIHVLASSRYRGCHLIGSSVDQPDKAARTVLGLMVETMYGGPSFMARLIPVYSLNAAFLFEQIERLIHIIHAAGGFVFLIMCDDLRANQSTYDMFREKFGAVGIYAVNHPSPNPEFALLYILHDPTHLFKNIRNNWVTEKFKTLDFVEPYTRLVHKAKWSDLIAIYNDEMKSPIKRTKLSYAALYPTNFEKQKVNLAVNVFNEKTVAVLTGKSTQVMVQNITKMWNILNVKTPSAGKRMNDEDRYPIRDENDDRLKYLEEIADCFNQMTSTYTHRIRSLTDDTRKGLYITLYGIVDMTKMLIRDKKFEYVLLGVFQNDPIEGEYGVFRGDGGGNMYIAYEQILSSLTLRRIKLFDKLNMEYSNDHSKDACCDAPLTEKEVDLLDNIPVEQLSDTEQSTLYYICGYICAKHDMGLAAPEKHVEASEFTDNVSRGLLKHPPAEFFELAMSLFVFYKNVENKSCSNRLLKGFKCIYESSAYTLDEVDKILRRFVNTFAKGFSNQKTEEIRVDKKNRKKKKERQLRSMNK